MGAPSPLGRGAAPATKGGMPFASTRHSGSGAGRLLDGGTGGRDVTTSRRCTPRHVLPWSARHLVPRNHGRAGSVQCAMTPSTSLPAMRTHGPIQVSCARFDDPALYGRLLAAAPRTGRCPVLLSDATLTRLGDGRHSTPNTAAVGRHGAGAVLAGRWPGPCLTCSEWIAPFGAAFPGLTPPYADAADLQPEAVVAAAVREAAEPRHLLLGIAPVSRPADVPAAAGWSGMCNSWDDVTEVSAVLRSWEDRFGAVLVRMLTSTLDLAVAAPPWTEADCLRVAAEHFAFTCDDDSPTPKTLRQYAQGLRGARRWSFWWD
jgi:hypothetical protein